MFTGIGAYDMKKSWGKVSEDGFALVYSMLQVDVKKRLTMNEILDHSWMMDDEVKEKVRKFVLANSSFNFPFKRTDLSTGPTDRMTASLISSSYRLRAFAEKEA